MHSGRLIKTAETPRPPRRPCSGTCRPQWQLWKSVPVHCPALSARSLGARSLARARVLEQPISCEGGGRPEGWSSPRDAQNHAMTRERWWPGLAAGWQVLRWGQTPEQHRHKCPQGLPCEQLSQTMLHRQASRLSQSSRHCLLQGVLQHWEPGMLLPGALQRQDPKPPHLGCKSHMLDNTMIILRSIHIAANGFILFFLMDE